MKGTAAPAEMPATLRVARPTDDLDGVVKFWLTGRIPAGGAPRHPVVKV